MAFMDISGSEFTGNQNLSGGNSGGFFNALKGFGNKAGDYIGNNPGQTALILGELSKAVAPGNPFVEGAGTLGSALGKSKIAGDAASAQAAKDDAFKQSILGALSKGYTPGGDTGINSVLNKADKMGGFNTTINLDPSDSPQGPAGTIAGNSGGVSLDSGGANKDLFDISAGASGGKDLFPF